MYKKLESSKLSEEERRHYRRWWKKYIALKRIAQIGMPTCLLLGLLSFGDQKFSQLPKFLVLPAFCVTVIFSLWWAFLECPRCGHKFSGWGELESDVWIRSECDECGLSHYDLSVLAKRG